jgi:hypothetical protein
MSATPTIAMTPAIETTPAYEIDGGAGSGSLGFTRGSIYAPASAGEGTARPSWLSILASAGGALRAPSPAASNQPFIETENDSQGEAETGPASGSLSFFSSRLALSPSAPSALLSNGSGSLPAMPKGAVPSLVQSPSAVEPANPPARASQSVAAPEPLAPDASQSAAPSTGSEAPGRLLQRSSHSSADSANAVHAAPATTPPPTDLSVPLSFPLPQPAPLPASAPPQASPLAARAALSADSGSIPLPASPCSRMRALTSRSSPESPTEAMEREGNCRTEEGREEKRSQRLESSASR